MGPRVGSHLMTERRARLDGCADMTFVEAVAIVRRHKLLVVYGLLLACLAATFSGYRLEDGRLVAKASPTYQSTAVVAVRPGAEHPTTTTVGPPPPTTTPPPTETGTDSSVSTPTTTAVPNTVPLAPLSAVIDSRAMYYTALSLKTVVVSPGFAEAVKARAPMMDGTVSAVVAQDTNTMDVVVDGSTPDIAAETMSATLAELAGDGVGVLGHAGHPVRASTASSSALRHVRGRPGRSRRR